MRAVVWGILAAGMAFTSVAARATDEDAFLGVLKKYGVTDDGGTSRKPCLCSGGLFDRHVGVLVAALDNGNNGYFQYDCFLPSFNSEGTNDGGGSCVNAGGSCVTLGK